MAVITPLNQSKVMSGDTTAKATYVDAIGKAAIDGFKCFGDMVLVATYQEPEKTKSGLFLPSKSTEESRYQGRCGMLLKAGPEAFKWDKSGQFEWTGDVPQEGEWMVFHYSDSRELFLNGVSCRLVSSRALHGSVLDPRTVL